jgi:hypothetical protein
MEVFKTMDAGGNTSSTTAHQSTGKTTSDIDRAGRWPANSVRTITNVSPLEHVAALSPGGVINGAWGTSVTPHATVPNTWTGNSASNTYECSCECPCDVVRHQHCGDLGLVRRTSVS